MVTLFKELSFEKIINAPNADLRELRNLAWNGIPEQYRAITWKLLLGYLPTNNSRRDSCLERRRQEYISFARRHYNIDGTDDLKNLMSHDEKLMDQISKDVPRTAPNVEFYSNNRVLGSIERILFLWSIRHPASSYVQGMNDLVIPFLSTFLSESFNGKEVDLLKLDEISDEVLHKAEADSYWCLTNFLYGIQDHYTSDQPGVQKMVEKLEEVVRTIEPGLYSHFQKVELKFVWFSFKWMNCFLLREFNRSCALRLFDTYLSEEKNGLDDFHVFVCAALLLHFKSSLKELDFDDLFSTVQNLPVDKWCCTDLSMLLSEAHILRFRNKKLGWNGYNRKCLKKTKPSESEDLHLQYDVKYHMTASILYDQEILID